MSNRRVVITGIGLATALGLGTAQTWEGLVAGRSGIGPITLFDPASLETRIAAEIKDFDPKAFVANRRSLRMMTRNDQLAVAGAALAVSDAGWGATEETAEMAALFVGSNKEISIPEHLLEGALTARNEDGTTDIRRMGATASSSFYPLFYVEGLQAASLFYISEQFGLKGANTYFAGTADVGLTAIGRAFRAIRRGEADAAIAGGFDDASSWWTMTKFDGLGVLTRRNDDGAAAYRPYDRDRSGSVLGEGAALMVLEEYAAATARGARIYGEIVGFGSGYDAYRLITPHPEGRGLARAMRSAMEESGGDPTTFGYIAAHGCATVLGDASETRAIRDVFGAAADGLAVSSVKPATGHLVAGAGALNAAVAALAVHHQTIPPTLHLEHPDPACDLDYVPGAAREAALTGALALARGLAGQNVALAIRPVR